MPRFPRNYIKTTFFHVITQGINKSYIFEKTEDIKYYIKIMYKLEKEQKVRIIAYCIMHNHTHMLIEVEGTKELSKYMQRLNTIYGIYYNKKYNRVGYVFRDRFKSEGIYNEEHLYNCIRYIYNNPVKAGICNKPEEYPYSNYKKIDNEVEENYQFMEIDEDKEKVDKNFIENFLLNNKIELTEIKENMQKLKEIITVLKDEYNISLRKISESFNINREKIRKIYKYKQ